MVSRSTRTLSRGFTLIELLVVMAILATLLTIAAPKYFDSLDRAKEAALRTDLRVMREAIDKHKSDTGRWPANLQQLVQERYLRAMPVDPITDRPGSWVIVESTDPAQPGVQDIRSGATGRARDGTLFMGW